MKKFLIFAGDDYYPLGGWSDFVDSYDTHEEVEKIVAKFIKSKKDWYQVVYRDSMKVIFGNYDIDGQTENLLEEVDAKVEIFIKKIESDLQEKVRKIFLKEFSKL